MAFTAKTRLNLIMEVIGELSDFGNEDFLDAQLAAGATSLTATNYVPYKKNTILEIEQEFIKTGTSNASSTTVSGLKRGVRGTTDALHADGSLVRFNPKYPQSKIVTLINTCIESELQQRKTTDASTTSAGNDYKYDLPTGISEENLRGVYMRSSATDASARTEGPPILNYRINKGQGTSNVDEIEFRAALPVGRYIAFDWVSGYTILETDGASCDLPLNPAAHNLPVLYACAQLLPFRENKRLRRDRNTYLSGSTPAGARERTGSWYWEQFRRIRKEQGLVPSKSTPLTVGWET